MPPRFRFGVQVSRAPSAREWLDLARRLEAIGYDVLCMPDHVDGDLFAPFPALAAAATVTSRIRLGQLVLANDFRNPLLLAREALTLDVLSEGRLELGMGAGGNAQDHEQLGIPLDAPRTRLERLTESVRLIKRLFTEDEVTVVGRHYALRRARAFPRPSQRPRPSILVAGGGPRILALAAREADVVGLFPTTRFTNAPRYDFSWRSAELQTAHVRESAAGRDVEFQVLIPTLILTDDRASAVADLARRYEQNEATIAGSPYVLVGSLDTIREQLVERRERLGISYFTVRGPDVERLAPVIGPLAVT
jgi:probable F420-dependent oxidoreductase